ncbi:MAG: hypothetical protein AAFY65_00950 [Pseudomonadota bacterium]
MSRTLVLSIGLAAWATMGTAGEILRDVVMDDYATIRGWEVRSVDGVPVGRLIHMDEAEDGYSAVVQLKKNMMPGVAALHVDILHLHDGYLCIDAHSKDVVKG